MAAADQVLHLPELLEMIFLYLPMRHLLTATRVCKTWQNNIQASHKLQRALFFESAPGERLKFSHKRHHLSCSNNMQPQDRFLQHYKDVVYQLPPPDLAVAESWEYMWTSPFPAPRHPVSIIINPLFDIFLTTFGTHFESLSESSTSTSPSSTSATSMSPPAWRRPEASWRRMLLTDRPFKGEMVFYTETFSLLFHNCKKKIKDSRKWTLGRIFDRAERHVGKAPWIRKVRKGKTTVDLFDVRVKGYELWDEMEGEDGWPDDEDETVAAIMGRDWSGDEDAEEETLGRK